MLARLEHSSDEATGCSLGGQQFGDGAFCVTYSPMGGEVSSSRIGSLTLGPVPPDGSPVDQVPAMSAQFLNQRSPATRAAPNFATSSSATGMSKTAVPGGTHEVGADQSTSRTTAEGS